MRVFVSIFALVVILITAQITRADKVRSEIVKARVKHAEEIKAAKTDYKMARRRANAKVSKVYKQAMDYLAKRGRRSEVPALRKEMESFIAFQKEQDTADHKEPQKTKDIASKKPAEKVIHERKPGDIARMVVDALEAAATLDTQAKQKTVELEKVTKIAKAIHGATVKIGFPIEDLVERRRSRGRQPVYRLSLKFPPAASVRHGNRIDIRSMGSIELSLSKKDVLSISKGDVLEITGKAYLAENRPESGMWVLYLRSFATYNDYYLCLGAGYSFKIVKPKAAADGPVDSSENLPRFPRLD